MISQLAMPPPLLSLDLREAVTSACTLSARKCCVEPQLVALGPFSSLLSWIVVKASDDDGSSTRATVAAGATDRFRPAFLMLLLSALLGLPVDFDAAPRCADFLGAFGAGSVAFDLMHSSVAGAGVEFVFPCPIPPLGLLPPLCFPLPVLFSFFKGLILLAVTAILNPSGMTQCSKYFCRS